jgi:rubrerythrin
MRRHRYHLRADNAALYFIGGREMTDKEKWNEHVETCSDCGIRWKKIGKPCPVCYAPAERTKENTAREATKEDD